MKTTKLFLLKTLCAASLIVAVSCKSTTPGGADNTTYTVKFITFGGTAIPDQTVAAGKTATRPSVNPTKDEYVFTNWYTLAEGLRGIIDPLGIKPYDYSTPIVADLTLNAGFLIASLSINFDANGGSLTTPLPSATVNAILSPASLTYSYVDANNALNDFGKALKSNTEVLQETTKNGNPFQGYSFNKDASSAADLVIAKKYVTATSPNGFEYNGALGAALLAARGSFPGIAPKAPTLYAAYYPTPAGFSVTFYTELGQNPPYDKQNIATGGKATKPADPSIADYTFMDWRTSDEGIISLYGDPRESKAYNFDAPVAENVELYAGFLINKLPITFDINGGSGSLANASATADLVVTPQGPFYPYANATALNSFGNALAANVNALKNSKKDGKSFKGFRLDADADNNADGSAKPDSDTNLLIKLRTPDPTNPLTFEFNTANGLGMAKFPVKGSKVPSFLGSPGAKLKAVYY